MKRLPKVVAIVGPTATGKSDLAVTIARRFRGEIISADSRQVYRGLDIGSGKITQREMQGIPHYLLDIADPRRERYTVENFTHDGTSAISWILSRGALPIICGGTGFYIDALVHGAEFPAVVPDAVLRRRLAKKTPEALMKMLRKLDSRRARDIDPHNKVRIIRAIEIARTLGSVPRVKRHRRYDVLWIGLDLPRPELCEKIHTRLIRRMKGGRLVNEVRRLQGNGVSWKRLYDFGLEYRHVSEYLKKTRGETSRSVLKTELKNMLALLEQDIVHFSKRQMTWFRRNRDIKWFRPGENAAIAREVRKFLS